MKFFKKLFKRTFKRRVSNRVGELRVGSVFSFIDLTVEPPQIRIGYIQKIHKEKQSISIYVPSMKGVVKVHKQKDDKNYFYKGS